MFDVILISHGPLSKAMLESAELICGEQEGVKTYGLYLGDSVDEFGATVREGIEESLGRGEVLVISDIQCGSPYNVACQAMGEYGFVHLTGMNLPLVVEALTDRIDLSVEETAQSCVGLCSGSIVHVNELFDRIMLDDADEDDE